MRQNFKKSDSNEWLDKRLETRDRLFLLLYLFFCWRKKFSKIRWPWAESIGKHDAIVCLCSCSSYVCIFYMRDLFVLFFLCALLPLPLFLLVCNTQFSNNWDLIVISIIFLARQFIVIIGINSAIAGFLHICCCCSNKNNY